MSQRKVGTLDNPSLYDARTKAVYARSAGFFFLLDDARIAMGGTQRWTTNEGVQMRGNVPCAPGGVAHDAPMRDDDRAFEADLERAIAASLAEPMREEPMHEEPMRDAPVDDEPAGERAANAEANGDTDEPPAARDGSRCVICLDDDARVDHMVAPCHHLCLCAGCATRVRRQRLACPVCRRAQRGVVRVFL